MRSQSRDIPKCQRVDAMAGERDDITTRINARYGGLRKSEKLVADYLLAHAHERLEMTITEFAATLDISEATISRFTRALGYKGFSDMKLNLAADSSAPDQFINLPSTMSESDGLHETGSKLLHALGRAMSQTFAKLDEAGVQRAIDAILTSQRVVLFGVGGAASVCDEAAHMLLKAGIDARAVSDGYTQIITATNSDSDTTVIGVSHTGTTRTVANALICAREQGAKTVAITDAPDSPVGRAAETTLTTWTHDTPPIPLYGDFLEGRICQLYLVNLIYLGVIFNSRESASHHLNATAHGLVQYYQQG